MRIGIADHLGWAVAVTADTDHDVVDRRRIELIGPDLSAAPIHYDRGVSDDDAMAELIARARASMVRVTTAALDELANDLPEPVETISLRSWPDDLPEELALQRQPPYEARVDAIRYREVLDEVARERGWVVCTYEAKDVVGRAVALLGDRADDVLQGPRARLGPPWTKDHRVALAATVVAG